MFKEHLLLAVCQSSNYCVHVKGSTFYAVPNFKGFFIYNYNKIGTYS